MSLPPHEIKVRVVAGPARVVVTPLGARGPTGAQGPAGSSAASSISFEAPSAYPVSAWRVMALDESGLARYAQPVLGDTVIGISAAAGTDVSYIRTGIYSDPSWNWTIRVPIVMGWDGVMTQTQPPDAQVLQRVALPLSPTRIIIRIEAPIILP